MNLASARDKVGDRRPRGPDLERLPGLDLDASKVEMVAPAPVGQVVEHDPGDGPAGPAGELPGGADVFGVLFEMLAAELAVVEPGQRRPKSITAVARMLLDLGARADRAVIRGDTLSARLGHVLGRYDGHSQTTTWAALAWLRRRGFLARTRRAFVADGEYRQLANRYSLRVPRSGPARTIFDRWLPARRAKASYRQRTAAEQAAIDRAISSNIMLEETPAPGDGHDDGACPECTWNGRPTFDSDGCCRRCGVSPPPPDPVAEPPP